MTNIVSLFTRSNIAELTMTHGDLQLVNYMKFEQLVLPWKLSYSFTLIKGKNKNLWFTVPGPSAASPRNIGLPAERRRMAERPKIPNDLLTEAIFLFFNWFVTSHNRFYIENSEHALVLPLSVCSYLQFSKMADKSWPTRLDCYTRIVQNIKRLFSSSKLSTKKDGKFVFCHKNLEFILN